MTKEELISWRKVRGLTQGALGDLIGASRQAVIHWERGRYAIPDDLEVRLMRAAPREENLRQRREGRITPASHPRLYNFERDIMRHRPNAKHPNALARKGLFGWSGLSWLYSNVSDCQKPGAELLDTDEYAQALEDLDAKRIHPGVEAVKHWFMHGALQPGVRIEPPAHGYPWPKLYVNEAVEPWQGFNNPWTPPTLPAGAWAIVRPPLPAGYYWSPTNQMVFLEEGDGT